MTDFTERLIRCWARVLYIQPLFYLVLSVSIFLVARTKKREASLKSLCLIYLVTTFCLGSSIDIMYSLFGKSKNRPVYEKYLMFSETLNLVFTILETYIFFKIINYNINTRFLIWYRTFSIVVLLAVFPFALISVWNNQGYSSIVFPSDIFSYISYTLLTIGLIFYNRYCYLKEITWTYTTELISTIFSYVLISLLLFPAYSYVYKYFYKSHFHLLIRFIHIFITMAVCIAMSYTIVRKKEHPNQGLKFEI
jgi:hypothetical protein